MTHWLIVFLLVAALVSFFAYGRVAAVLFSIARMLFNAFLFIFFFMLVSGLHKPHADGSPED